MGLLRNKLTEICEDILFKNEAKNAGIAALRRLFLTKLLDERASRFGLFISLQPLCSSLAFFFCFFIFDVINIKGDNNGGKSPNRNRKLIGI